MCSSPTRATTGSSACPPTARSRPRSASAGQRRRAAQQPLLVGHRGRRRRARGRHRRTDGSSASPPTGPTWTSSASRAGVALGTFGGLRGIAVGGLREDLHRRGERPTGPGLRRRRVQPDRLRDHRIRRGRAHEPGGHRGQRRRRRLRGRHRQPPRPAVHLDGRLRAGVGWASARATGSSTRPPRSPSTPTATCGSPTRATTASRCSARTARSSSSSAARGPSPVSSPARTASPCGVGARRSGSPTPPTTRSTGGPGPRTDARVKRGAAGPLAGNNVYNATGVEPVPLRLRRRRPTVTYYVSVQNDVPQPEAFRLKGWAAPLASPSGTSSGRRT